MCHCTVIESVIDGLLERGIDQRILFKAFRSSLSAGKLLGVPVGLYIPGQGFVYALRRFLL